MNQEIKTIPPELAEQLREYTFYEEPQRDTTFKTRRIQQADLLSTEEAAALVGSSRVTINGWIKSKRVIAVKGFKRGFKLPKWQFHIEIFDALPIIIAALGDNEWAALIFMEQHSDFLGCSPLQALLTGSKTKVEVMSEAIAYAH